jgi:hypothetical protein
MLKKRSQTMRENRADSARWVGDQNSHDGFGPIYHFFQGALPLDQRSSRYRLSRRVSIGCQKPS